MSCITAEAQKRQWHLGTSGRPKANRWSAEDRSPSAARQPTSPCALGSPASAACRSSSAANAVSRVTPSPGVHGRPAMSANCSLWRQDTHAGQTCARLSSRELMLGDLHGTQCGIMLRTKGADDLLAWHMHARSQHDPPVQPHTNQATAERCVPRHNAHQTGTHARARCWRLGGRPLGTPPRSAAAGLAARRRAGASARGPPRS